MMLLQKKGHNLPFRSNRILHFPNPLPPFRSFTGLILGVSPNPFPPIPQNDVAAAYSDFVPVTRELDIKDDYPIVDEESVTFRSSGGGGDGDGNVVIVAGYTAILPPHTLSVSWKIEVLFIDNIYIRKCYRGLGFGTTMFSVRCILCRKERSVYIYIFYIVIYLELYYLLINLFHNPQIFLESNSNYNQNPVGF